MSVENNVTGSASRVLKKAQGLNVSVSKSKKPPIQIDWTSKGVWNLDKEGIPASGNVSDITSVEDALKACVTLSLNNGKPWTPESWRRSREQISTIIKRWKTELSEAQFKIKVNAIKVSGSEVTKNAQGLWEVLVILDQMMKGKVDRYWVIRNSSCINRHLERSERFDSLHWVALCEVAAEEGMLVLADNRPKGHMVLGKVLKEVAERGESVVLFNEMFASTQRQKALLGGANINVNEVFQLFSLLMDKMYSDEDDSFILTLGEEIAARQEMMKAVVRYAEENSEVVKAFQSGTSFRSSLFSTFLEITAQETLCGLDNEQSAPLWEEWVNSMQKLKALGLAPTPLVWTEKEAQKLQLSTDNDSMPFDSASERATTAVLFNFMEKLEAIRHGAAMRSIEYGMPKALGCLLDMGYSPKWRDSEGFTAFYKLAHIKEYFYFNEDSDEQALVRMVQQMLGQLMHAGCDQQDLLPLGVDLMLKDIEPVGIQHFLRTEFEKQSLLEGLEKAKEQASHADVEEALAFFYKHHPERDPSLKKVASEPVKKLRL